MSILAEWNRKFEIMRKRQKRGCWKNYYDPERLAA